MQDKCPTGLGRRVQNVTSQHHISKPHGGPEDDIKRNNTFNGNYSNNVFHPSVLSKKVKNLRK